MSKELAPIPRWRGLNSSICAAESVWKRHSCKFRTFFTWIRIWSRFHMKITERYFICMKMKMTFGFRTKKSMWKISPIFTWIFNDSTIKIIPILSRTRYSKFTWNTIIFMWKIKFFSSYSLFITRKLLPNSEKLFRYSVKMYWLYRKTFFFGFQYRKTFFFGIQYRKTFSVIYAEQNTEKLFR